jgi:gas vesicle protein GvpL/GvpF
MPVLAYCITEPEPDIKVPEVGVQGHAIRSLHQSGLHCFVSDYGDQAATNPARESALAFSQVLQEIFRQTAIIPFCFPTLLQDEAELATFLHEHAAQYREDLTRLRNLVQMEVQIAFQRGEKKPDIASQSGKDYLRSRQLRHQNLEAAAQEFRRMAQTHIRNWRQRDTPRGLRAYALVERDSVPAFRDIIGRVALSPDLSARVTGPWPATEFLTEKRRSNG